MNVLPLWRIKQTGKVARAEHTGVRRAQARLFWRPEIGLRTVDGNHGGTERNSRPENQRFDA